MIAHLISESQKFNNEIKVIKNESTEKFRELRKYRSAILEHN